MVSELDHPGQTTKDDETSGGKVRNHGTRNREHERGSTTTFGTRSQGNEAHGEDRLRERIEYTTVTKNSEIY